MIYGNFSVEQTVANFEAKCADGFSAVETKSEGLAVSYDARDFISTFFSNFGNNGVNYGDYNDGSTVYVFGTTDSFVDFSTGNYSTAINIDASNSSGINILGGNSASNIILGGSYYNFMSGGSYDYTNDILVGGNGMDVFVCGKYGGNDTILNASSNDTVFLEDATLSDIAFTASDGYTLGILFTTGNVLTISDTSSAGADIMLSDGSTYWYGYASKTWHQTA